MPAMWAAGAAVVGDVMAQQGQEQTNAAQFANQMQMEQWQTAMSDTQMQRRVQDLKMAGLNPMLAVGGPGAAMPMASMANFQNPSASFGNLGGQVSGAIQLDQQQSQIEANRAAANKANADANKANVDANKAAGVDTDVAKQNVLESQSRQALQSVQADAARAQASLSSAQAAVAQATLPKIQAEIRLMGSQSDLASAKANVENINSMLGELDIQQKQAIMPSVIESAHNAMIGSHLDLFEKQAMAEFFASGLGSASPAANQLIRIVTGTRAVLR